MNHISPNGIPSSFQGEISKKERLNLNGRQLSTVGLDDQEKIRSCLKSVESDFETQESAKGMIGANSFVSLAENSNDDDSDEDYADLINDYELSDILESIGEKIETQSEVVMKEGEEVKAEGKKVKTKGDEVKSKGKEVKTEGVEDKTEGEAVKTKGEEGKTEGEEIKIKEKIVYSKDKTGLLQTKEQFGNLFKSRIQLLEKVWNSEFSFNDDIAQLYQKIATASKEEQNLFLSAFVYQAIKEGKIGKIVNGEFVPLNEDETKSVRKELETFFANYFFITPTITPTQELKPKHENGISPQSKNKEPETYIVVPYTANRRIFNSDRPVQTIIKLSAVARLIILAEIIIKHIQEKAAQEKTEEKKEELRERILSVLLKSEILRTEILKREVTLQEIRFAVNQSVNLPMRILIKVRNIFHYSNQIRMDAMELQLPGLHKIRPLAAKAAA